MYFLHRRLTQIFVRILLRILLPVEPKCMLLSTIWSTKFYKQYKKKLTFSLFGRRVRNWEVTGF